MKLFKPIFKHWSYLADLVVIILGIVIALSHDAWWQNKQDRRLEKHYLGQLYTEFIESETILTKDYNLRLSRKESAIRILKTIHEDLNMPVDSIGIQLLHSRYNTSVAIVDGTYKALIQSGHISLISNDSLRSKLASYGKKVDIDMSRLNITMEASLNLWMSNFVFDEIGDIVGLNSPEFRKSNYGLSEYKYSVDYLSLLKDKRLSSFVEKVLVHKIANLTYVGRIRDATREIIKSLEVELGIEKPEEQ